MDGGRGMPTRSTRMVRILFVAVILAVPVQYGVAKRFGEPYPSLIMPSFAGDNTQNGVIHTTSIDVRVKFCDGREATLRPDQLLDPLPRSHVPAAMDWMFGRREQAPLAIPAWKRWVFEHVSPGYAKRARRQHGASFVDAETKRWLSAQVARQSDGKIPESITVLWYRDAYDLSAGFPVRSRQPASAARIQLGCES